MHRHEVERLLAEEDQEVNMSGTTRRRPRKEIRDKTRDMVMKDSREQRESKSRYKKVSKKTVVSQAAEKATHNHIAEEIESSKDIIEDTIKASLDIAEVATVSESVTEQVIPEVPQKEGKVYGFVLMGDVREVKSESEEPVKTAPKPETVLETVAQATSKVDEIISFKSVMSSFFNLFA